MNYPSTRKEAVKSGAKYYFTGKPCNRGHVALRKTKGCCIECMKEDWNTNNKKRKSKPKSEAAKAAGRRYYEKNKELVIARAKARPAEDKNRWKKQYKDRNPELYKSINSFRRRRHRNATPPWLTYFQKRDIKALYVQAMTLSKITGEQYVVDHIVPLNNPEVCGLHVPWNLRVITQEENLAKSNKHNS